MATDWRLELEKALDLCAFIHEEQKIIPEPSPAMRALVPLVSFT